MENETLRQILIDGIVSRFDSFAKYKVERINWDKFTTDELVKIVGKLDEVIVVLVKLHVR